MTMTMTNHALLQSDDTLVVHPLSVHSRQAQPGPTVEAPLPAGVRVLIAPPLTAGRVWAGFHLPRMCLRLAGWPSDYLAGQRRTWSYRDYEKRLGGPARRAYDRLAATGAHVTADATRHDLEDAFASPTTRAIIVVGHYTAGGIELADGIMPGHVVMALWRVRGTRGTLDFTSIACLPDIRTGAIVSEAPDTFPFSAPLLMPLPTALQSIAWWIEGLDGRTPLDVARQRALVRSL
jgi:hypothetical protein